MRICFVSLPSLPYHTTRPGPRGGAERQTALLARSLAARGHDVSVVLNDYEPGMERRTDLPLIRAYRVGDGVPGLRFLPRWRALHRALAAADADAYFQMCAAAATGQTAFYCQRRRRGFVFATASDTDVVRRAVRLNLRDRRIYQWGLRRADRIITQHPRQARLLRQEYGLDSTPFALGATPLGDPVAFAGAPTVLWLGSLRAVKEPQAWLDVAERVPEARFIMVGGRSATEPAVFDRARERAAAMDNVEFLGPVDDLEPVLRESWVLLNTSSVEGFPTTFLEAWSIGVPTVSHFDPGMIRERGFGWVADTPDALVEALRTALTDDEERIRRGAAGRRFVAEENSEDAVADKALAELEAAATNASRR